MSKADEIRKIDKLVVVVGLVLKLFIQKVRRNIA